MSVLDRLGRKVSAGTKSSPAWKWGLHPMKGPHTCSLCIVLDYKGNVSEAIARTDRDRPTHERRRVASIRALLAKTA